MAMESVPDPAKIPRAAASAPLDLRQGIHIGLRVIEEVSHEYPPSKQGRRSVAQIANPHLPEKVMLGRGCPCLANSSAFFQAAAASLLS